MVKINPTGTVLLYSTFLSGGAIGSQVFSTGIAVDSLGDAYVIGYDNDAGPFPPGSPGGLLTTLGSLVSSCPGSGCGGFLAKINIDATVLAYSTYLANVTEYVTPTAVAVDQDGNAYVSGYTTSTDFPSTPGVLQYSFTPPGAATTNLEDGFVIKMNQLGDGYAYATLLGGTATNTLAAGIAVDSAGHAFVTGTTRAGYPTTPDAFQTTDQGTGDQQFLSELDPIGASLLYSTFLAGTTGNVFDTQPSTSGVSYLATDPSGNAYLTGQTNSTDFPTTAGAFQTNSPLAGGSQTATGFVAKIAFAVEIGTGTSSDLAISASASPNPVAVNSTLTYTLTVTNNGPSNATGVTLTDQLPIGTSFQSAAPSQGACANSSGTVTCSIGPLTNGATATITLTLTTPVTAGSPSNTATVSGNQTDPDPSNNSATTVVNVTLPVSLSIAKTAPSVVTIGENLTYTVIVTNNSTGNTATNATVTDPLPPGVNFQSYSATQGTCTGPAVGSSGMIICSLGTLAGGAAATISLVVVPTAVNSALANTATVTADQVNSNPNNSSTATVNVQGAVMVNVSVSERIHVTDTPGVLGAAMVPVSETIHVMDAPGALGAAMVPVSEAIHVEDTLGTAFPVPNLTIAMTSLTVQGTEYLATFTISNIGGATANNVSVTGAALVTIDIIPAPPPLPPLPVFVPHITNPTNPLPIILANIDPGTSEILKISYPINALDAERSRAQIEISGTFDGGSVSGDFKTTLPP